MASMEALVDILKQRVSIEQLRNILEDISDAMPDGYCPICFEEDIPVDENGHEIEGDDVSEAVEYQERHTDDCFVTYVERYLVISQ